ncbi:hypothetical protein CIL05_11740 [Virgibacillus profundi]|uniref:Transcobalamin-like C-terminal domain-containing protein n=1 Tax=Virgibacillus profundi TaxID=2024555 RepID=A0A2A2IDT4_9BACI|nr:DUF4430 domain-containing protein [Virgibacillus profundi]PAV29528.1 hypothetical protein CIL05_11740 [Virgibacillus profundi]PXY53698.1 DUF4430 domain-containing protein [Virgibacillus profundi]
MNKWILRLGSIFVVFALLAGCGSDENNEQNSTSTNNSSGQEESNQESEEVSEDSVLITISKDEGSEFIHEKEIEIEEGDILMDVMKENFYVEEEDGFITSIERAAPKEDEQKAWMFFVNDEMAPVGAHEFELTPGDKITFDLQSWE